MVANYASEMSEREDILLKIMHLAQEIGVEFAFPTRTLHLETMPTAGSSGSTSASGGGAAAVTPFVPKTRSAHGGQHTERRQPCRNRASAQRQTEPG
jgi:hypothetical protein